MPKFYTPPSNDPILRFFPGLEEMVRRTRVALEVPQALVAPGIL